METDKTSVENIFFIDKSENVGRILDNIIMNMKMILKKSAGVML